jgi:hypothetical protein
MKYDMIVPKKEHSEHNFIIDTIQRGRKKPKKYRHDLTMPIFLYDEMVAKGVIYPEEYFVDETAFFEFTQTEAIMSFVNLFACEDMVHRIDRYIIVKFAGIYPLKRNGRMF